jgi:DNA invertase Pin-like site-specific DNA recombinase
MPLAYSYLRFSSPQQATGDSLRRQTKARQDWLAAHPEVELDRSLVMTDAGRSAFKRKGWDTYALARFVECIKSGRVERDSYLLVENLDRLSREDAGEATELFLSIVNKGVVIIQLSPAVLEFRRPVNVQQLMFAIVELSRGHSESAIKSERGRAFWARKQREASARVVTRKLPGWVRCVDGRLVLDEVNAETVRRMFALAREGYGATAIAQRLNADKTPVMGRKEIAARGQEDVPVAERVRRPVLWSGSLVWHILTSRATIGEYVPYRRRGKDASPGVPNYYPSVIDPETYHAVRGAIASRGKVGRGRRGKRVNLFAGLLVDARDGGSLSYWNNGGHPPVLISVNAKEGKGVPWVSFPAEPFEEAVLSKLTEIKASDIQTDNKAARRVETIAGQIAALDNLIKLWTAKMDDPAIVDTVAAKLADLNTERKALATKQSEAQRKAASPLAESWGEFKGLADLLKQDTTDELRVRMRAALRRSIASVTTLIVSKGRRRLAAVRIDFAGGGTHRDYLIRYKMANVGAIAPSPAVTEVVSFAKALENDALDLRDREQALQLAEDLAAVELEG